MTWNDFTRTTNGYRPREMTEITPVAAQWPNDIRGRIDAKEVNIGVGVVIEEGVEIRAERVTLGDFVYIGRGTRAFVPELTIGEYTRINEGSFLNGSKPMHIGNKCYFGRGVILDSRGGLIIGHHAGAGAGSQIWTHIRHGDTVRGCRYNSEWPLVIEDDAWLVARVTVGGARFIGARAMVRNESNVTRDLEADHTYMGCPAKDVTERFGPQFESLTPVQMYRNLQLDIMEFETEYPQHARKLKACLDASEFDTLESCFEVTTRTYTKRMTAAEVAYMRWSLSCFLPAEGV